MAHPETRTGSDWVALDRFRLAPGFVATATRCLRDEGAEALSRAESAASVLDSRDCDDVGFWERRRARALATARLCYATAGRWVRYASGPVSHAGVAAILNATTRILGYEVRCDVSYMASPGSLLR